MNKIVKKYDRPGKWEVVIPFENIGEEIVYLGVIDARESGDYELKIVADHQVVNTKGRITVRVVVGENANVKIKGIIRIAKEAQETDDYLELRVLTLSPLARAIVEPELEIEANNVKASHGASVGQIDLEQLLYLESRGLSKASAQELIIEGWLGV